MRTVHRLCLPVLIALLPACASRSPQQAPAAAPAAPGAADVPSPESVLGFQVGADGHLAEWAQIVDYFGRLDRASDMVRVDTIGQTVLGRPMILAVISSAENIERIDEIRANQARLADPRGVPDAEIEELIRTQPAVAFIGASLHGNEIMATQMSMELGYDLATDPELGGALENVVVLLVPGMNPDGLDITRDWWLRTRQTEYADASMPWLYHFYTGHDNNRDFFMVTQPETRAVTRVLYEEWFPEVVWDVHQMGNSGARLFIPPFDDPLNPNLDPLLVRMTNLIGTQMALDLTEAGKPGIVHRQTFDLWWHGGGRTVPARHNMVGILSEAASTHYGDPIQQSPDSLRQPERGSLYPEPWPGGWWRPRDIVEYELIAGHSLVKLLDRQRESFVRNFVTLAQRQIEMGRQGDPFAYVFPPDQRDPGSAARLLRVLERGGVEVHEAGSDFTADGQTYPAGTRVVLMAQPFRAHAKDLLEVQDYPDRRQYPGGPPDPPYDLAGWTLPLQMGVEARPIAEPFSTDAFVLLDSIPVHPGTVNGSDDALAYALDPTVNAAHRAVFEILREGGEVNFVDRAIEEGEVELPVGAPLVWGVPDLGDRVERWAEEWGLDAVAVPTLPHEGIGSLRVGLYKPWTASMDEGWTRWMFEQWGVPFDTIHNDGIREGNLAARYDAIVIPDMSYRQIMEGERDAHPDYAGGLGAEGADALRQFVEEGGILLLLDSSSEFAIRELDVAVRDLLEDQEEDEGEEEGEDDDGATSWYAPGSVLRVRWNADHPIARGMPEESAIFYARSPVFDVDPDAENITVVARYPDDADEILLSGYAQAAERIAGKAALVVAEIGEGQVVMFGFRPQHRAQTHETFKPLFNALYREGR